jgi:hypothetical protein
MEYQPMPEGVAEALEALEGTGKFIDQKYSCKNS